MSRVWPYVTPNDPMRQICENAQSDRKRHGFGHSIEQISVNWLYWNWFWRNARNVPETLVITCSFLILLARWLIGIGGERHLYRSNWRAAFPVLSVHRLGGSQRIFFQSHKDCAAPPKEENLTNTLQRSKPALFRLN